jgi:pimeloyl-ACP methyl ester carboxylesterase
VQKQSLFRSARCAVLGALLTLAGAVLAGAAPVATRTVGNLTLHRCASAAPWCATLERPLDPRGEVPGTVPVYFEYYPHSGAGSAAGTLVATEGGPGYPATDSRAEYLTLFGPLRPRYDVLIMDNRGTGHSGAIDCQELQNAAALTEAGIGACGRSLGATAPLYSTALAADDLAAILDALAIERVGLYGDSYGTYFAQVFALRHAGRLRALVLDGAYPLDDRDYAWYPHYAPAMRDKFNLACARSGACGALPGSSLEHIAPALAALRIRPVTGSVRAGAGRPVTVTADATALAIVMFGGSPALSTVRETDAAARAYLAGDALPLLRLVAETASGVDSRDATHAPEKFSAGLAAAVFCQDPPQIFEMRLPVGERSAERDRLIAQRKVAAPGTYAPFTIDEYRAMPLDYAFIDECVEWPAHGDFPPSPLVFPAASYPGVPLLVLSGELDNMTTVADGAAAAERFPHAHHVVIANSFHVNALPHARSECGAVLARRFLDTLATGDERCAAAVPPVRLVAHFARAAHELEAAPPAAGNAGGEAELRAVTAALLTTEDAIARAGENGAGAGVGLRGGGFTAVASGAGWRIGLHALRWTEDVAVSGSVEIGGREGPVHATLTLAGPVAAGPLTLDWHEGASAPRAAVRGILNGRVVVAEAPAP